MKKIIAEKYESFKAKDLKNYSKIVNAYFRRKKYILLLALLTLSCSVQNEVNTDYYKTLEPNLHVSFYDKLDTIRNQYNSQFYTKSFIKTFTESEAVDYSKPISLKLQKDIMYLQFTNKNKKQIVLQFYGKKRHKKFVFYTNYETISFPVLLMKKEMQRFKVYISESKELIIQKYNVNEGMLLFFGAGNSYENVYRFKILKDE